MTLQQRKKLAEAARELAMECVAGTAPEFGTGVEFHRDGSPCCALGHVLCRAGFRPEPGHLYAFGDLIGEYISSAPLVTVASDTADLPTLPWALLSIADELESAP